MSDQRAYRVLGYECSFEPEAVLVTFHLDGREAIAMRFTDAKALQGFIHHLQGAKLFSWRPKKPVLQQGIEPPKK